ncbi:arrestin domain-containing protein 17-like [Mytilus trossulus]|uniref:arrestin domain-containing protein 17-like n=1 Tax=Mytilus trossulus TaxID=6551 RepID=UPI003006B298
MKEIREFLIELENNKDVYFPGDIVAGNLVLELWSPMQVEELKLTLSGEAKIPYWNTTDSFRSSYERYFKQSVVILESVEEIKDGHDVQEGVNKYPFTFELPPNLPTSFENSNVYVRYLSEATLVTHIHDRWICSNKVITVISHLDLNEIDNIDGPCEKQIVKNLCCLCCTTGPVTGILRLDRTGYIPGESINVNVEIMNMSRYTCNIEVIGIQTLSYTKMTDTAKLFCRSVHREVHPGDSDMVSEELFIQPNPPSGLTGCRIISIDYHVQVMVKPVCCLPFYIKQRIVIGTFPLQSMVEKYTMEYPDALSTTPTAKEFQLNFQESEYEGRIQFPSNDRFGQLTFRPKYPYFECLKNTVQLCKGSLR